MKIINGVYAEFGVIRGGIEIMSAGGTDLDPLATAGDHAVQFILAYRKLQVACQSNELVAREN